MKTRRTTSRRGFTLVELLVVMALVIVLAAMTVGLANLSWDSQKTVGAADRVSGWLLISKARALRDQAARGLRFYTQTNAAGQVICNEVQYVEQPDPWVPSRGTGTNATNQDNTWPRLVLVYPATGNPRRVDPANRALYYYEKPAAGAYADFNGHGFVAGDLIVTAAYGTWKLRTTPLTTTTSITLDGATVQAIKLDVDPQTLPDLGPAHVDNATTGTLVDYNFAFQPQAKPILGEPTLLLRESTTFNLSKSLGVPTATFDILFSPNGNVLGGGGSVMCLWIEQTDKDGEKVLVAVYPRTGAIATQPVDTDPATSDPFRFAKDGLNVGL